MSAEVMRTVLWDFAFWDSTEQIVQYVKPVVDAIGNLEAQDASMADCMLELLRCSRLLSALPPIPEGISALSPNDSHKGELVAFSNHAKGVFNTQFQILNSDLHFLCLYLHPLCRKLAISQSAKSRTLDEAIKIALGVAEKWKWGKATALALVRDINIYNAGKAPFAGGSVDGASWWDGLPVSIEQHPLKALAIRLWALVPHSAENEQLFSNLGGIQGRCQSNLTVETFESLGKLAAHYTALIHQSQISQGKPIRGDHAHMHTRPEPGIDIATARLLESSYVSTPTDSPRTPTALLQTPDLAPEISETSPMTNSDSAMDSTIQAFSALKLNPSPLSVTAELGSEDFLYTEQEITEELTDIEKEVGEEMDSGGVVGR
ncbi:hypothetical protein FRC01_012962 [Tulasnella sp. 417]|nr:hypothetical protein FRC01_012962 [Tulasnella sp. 417]